MTAHLPRAQTRAVDHLRLGRLVCDFMSRDTFLAICKEWFSSNHFHHAVTLNAEMVVQAEHDDDFRAAATAADMRIPDGAGPLWAQWYVRSQFWALLPSLVAFLFRRVERIPGVELVRDLARMCQEHKKPIYLLGGTGAQVEATAVRLQREFPDLQIGVSSGHEFDMLGPPEILGDIQRQQPAVLLVAYGVPKQTLWIEQHREDLPSVRIAAGVGGAFAILSEDTPRAPVALQQLNMEWLWRLILEPRRLPRIWKAVVTFPRLIAKQKADITPA